MSHPVIDIILEGDGAFPQLQGKEPIEINRLAIIGLAGGMQSGRPSMAFIFDLPDGRYVFAQTSLRAFLAAADAFKAHYGDPR